jgi:hypothetical protein
MAGSGYVCEVCGGWVEAGRSCREHPTPEAGPVLSEEGRAYARLECQKATAEAQSRGCVRSPSPIPGTGARDNCS